MAALTWSAEELASELGVSEWLIRRNLGRIPHLRIGQRIVFPKVAVARWLEDEPLALLALGTHDGRPNGRPNGRLSDDRQILERRGS